MTPDPTNHSPAAGPVRLRPPKAGLALPAALVPAWSAVPRYGWVLARAFTPRGNRLLAAGLWLPWTGQVAGARAYGGAATLNTGQARAVALLRTGDPRQSAALIVGGLAGCMVLYLLIGLAALAYVHLADVRTITAAWPVWAVTAWPIVAVLCVGWGTRQSLGRGHPQDPGVVRIGSLAAWPPNRKAGLKGLGRQLCTWADTRHVTLDLTARTPTLLHKYAQDGFTQPDPTRMWMIRQCRGTSPTSS